MTQAGMTVNLLQRLWRICAQAGTRPKQDAGKLFRVAVQKEKTIPREVERLWKMRAPLRKWNRDRLTANELRPYAGRSAGPRFILSLKHSKRGACFFCYSGIADS